MIERPTVDSVIHGGIVENMEQRKRTARPLRLTDDEAAPVLDLAARETEGNFSMAIRKLIADGQRVRALEWLLRGLANEWRCRASVAPDYEYGHGVQDAYRAAASEVQHVLDFGTPPDPPASSPV